MISSFSKSRMVVWMIWVIASIFYAYQYVLRVMPSIMLKDIMTQFHIDAAAFGQFSGIYYIGYALMHLPIGILLDRYGPRRVMAICILCTVIGLSPLIFATHWVYPIMGRLLIGMGSSAAILGVFKIVRMTFKEAHFARMLSLSVTIGLIGAIYGGGPVNYMCVVWGSQAVVYIVAAAGVGLAIVTYWIVPDIQTEAEATVLSDVKEVLSNSKVLLSCLFAGFMVGPLEGFADIWGTTFLSQVWGFEGSIAAKLPSLIFIGMCFGSPLLSFIAEKLGSHLLTIVSAGIIMTVAFVLLLTCMLSSSFLSLNFVVVGICCAYQILAIYKASTYVPERVAGLTTAVANMIIMVFGYIFHSVIGGIIDCMGGPQTAQALSYGIMVIPIALVLGSLGFLFLLIQEKRAGVLQQRV